MIKFPLDSKLSEFYEEVVSDILDIISEMRITGDFDENTLETLEWRISPPKESDNDWAYGSHYNTIGEFNPRLVACDLCGVYREPEEMTAGKINSITVSLCSICGVNNA